MACHSYPECVHVYSYMIDRSTASSPFTLSLKCAGITGISMLGSQRRRNVERIRTLVESGDDTAIEAIAKAIIFYQSCMQEDDLTTSVQTFQQLLQVSGRLSLFFIWELLDLWGGYSPLAKNNWFVLVGLC